MSKRELKSIIDAILFAWAEPIHIDEIMKVIEQDKKTTRELIRELQDECEHYRRGIVLNNYDDYYQYSTRSEHDEYLKKLTKSSPRKITSSTMEVLAIIAYNQPVTRIEIDNIRGVKSYSSIDTLKAKGLIEEVGRLDAVGKPVLYGTTIQFLKMFNLSSLDELPKIENLEELNTILENENDEN
ncbi:SMC-Scp complex subunit ScpB [Helcococcus ovis]|uniref:SMC-Scp complex subunit ScpB n=1 Tax=Helcococcus TaxID=31983 RepID=UPI0010704955|nr:SMC-Scp complex subunit ScpB [Helcococcus ovis]TFF68137.1 SMC-Scp complex subunit ScpB [Helcococcus ovis]WNZ01996.1 SMC-Scp complex subunit ScpB [Helcococcus ovis]